MARNIAVKVSWDGEDQKKVWFRLALFSRSTFIDTWYNMKKILLLTMNWMYLQLERRACFGGKRNCIGLSKPPFFSKKVSIRTIEWWMVHYHRNSCHSHYIHRHGSSKVQGQATVIWTVYRRLALHDKSPFRQIALSDKSPSNTSANFYEPEERAICPSWRQIALSSRS